MDAIKNTADLPQILAAENPKWQEIIYEQTGVIVLIKEKYGTLFSNCGFIDLDRDAWYCSANGVDITKYCDITNINSLIEYIKSMDGYKDCLIDSSYGKFTKSELFWAVYAHIICPEDNQRRPDGEIYQDWGLYSIGTYQHHTELHMALVDYDSCDFWLDISPETNLNEALIQLAKDMCDITEDIDEVQQYAVREDVSFSIPHSFQSLQAQLSEGGLFYWLK